MYEEVQYTTYTVWENELNKTLSIIPLTIFSVKLQSSMRLSSIKRRNTKQEVKVFHGKIGIKSKFIPDLPVSVCNSGKGAKRVPGRVAEQSTPEILMSSQE